MKYTFLLMLFSVVGTAQVKNKFIHQKNNCATEILIKADTSHFTKSFLSSLKILLHKGSWGKVIVHDHYITLNDTDTISFPNELNIGTQYHFKNEETNKTYKLNIKRINEVLIQYEALILSGTTTIFSQKGFAELNPGFFIGVEVSEDDKTGETYPASEYLDNQSKNGFTIKIGYAEAHGQIKAMWQMSGVANNSPTLR